MDYHFFKVTCGVVATIGLYSVLYRENKFYRFWEHVFLGLAAGYAILALWSETLKSLWWDKMVGTAADVATKNPGTPGHWLYAILMPIGLMGYFVFSKKNNWISRIPIGIVLGLYSGQQFLAWQNAYIPQLDDTMRPIIPNAGLFKPSTDGLPAAQVTAINSHLYVSQALNNIIFVFTVLAVLSYFLFSFEVKNKIIQNSALAGRWLLMVGFGAIFGSTVMMRFTLLIDRMYFICIEFFRDGLWHGVLHR
jgi:hypothetical protein